MNKHIYDNELNYTNYFVKNNFYLLGDYRPIHTDFMKILLRAKYRTTLKPVTSDENDSTPYLRSTAAPLLVDKYLNGELKETNLSYLYSLCEYYRKTGILRKSFSDEPNYNNYGLSSYLEMFAMAEYNIYNNRKYAHQHNTSFYSYYNNLRFPNQVFCNKSNKPSKCITLINTSPYYKRPVYWGGGDNKV